MVSAFTQEFWRSAIFQTDFIRTPNNRLTWPAYQRVEFSFDAKLLKESHDELRAKAREHKISVQYDSSECFDLTWVDIDKVKPRQPWAGTPSCRACGKHDKTRLKAQRVDDPLMFDGNHTQVFSWAEGSYAIQVAKQLGPMTRVSFATLHPGGWWPSHVDFHPGELTKWNLVASTNSDCRSIQWLPRKNRPETVHMAEGETWFINTGFYHGAHNWGIADRVHLLVTIEGDGGLFANS